MSSAKRADLVLSGGGVKGVGSVGSALYARGQAATQEFLSTWDWTEYLRRYR